MSLAIGSLRECEKEGAVIVGEMRVRGWRRVWTRVRKEAPLKVYSAPRRRWASEGSGNRSSSARE